MDAPHLPLAWHRAHFEALLARKDRLPHAILVRGPEGIGKRAFAMALAYALLCERPAANGAGCGACPACMWLGQDGHPDFRLVTPEQPRETAEEEGEGDGKPRKASVQIDVEQIRDLTHFLGLSTHRGRARVILVHPAETLNLNAANALLKGLEEPPPRTCFVLATHRWHQMLPTIRSRCQEVTLPLPAAGPALEWLKARGVARPELALAHAGGAPLLATGFDEGYWRVRERMLDAIGGADFDPLATAEALRDAAPATVVSLFQRWSFDLALQRVAGKARYNRDRAEALARLAPRLDALEVLRFQREMVRLQRVVHHPLNARLFLEHLFLAYAGVVRSGGLRGAA